MQAAPWQGHTGHLQTGPSKWWAWGLAIFLSIQVFFTLIGALISAIIPYDMLLTDWDAEEPGEYPVNGTSVEQDEWNFTKEEWDSYLAITEMMEDLNELKPLQIWTGIISSMIAMVAIVMLLQQSPNGFRIAYAWLGISTLGQLWMQHKMQAAMTDFFSNMHVEETAWMSVQTGMNFGSTLVCNTLLLMIIIMCSMKSQDKGEVEESGFHRQTILHSEQDGAQP
ncbi:MAG: hypothetical protein P8Q90_06935 [Candidatus Thalassarchaeaceae archaeon]|nr:hypothetical protein [Candidatus Thalassarchaeaceae archaeon]